jgi:hypothetical protein
MVAPVGREGVSEKEGMGGGGLNDAAKARMSACAEERARGGSHQQRQ